MTLNEMFDVVAGNSDILYSVKTKIKCDCNTIVGEKVSNYLPMNFKGDWQKIIGNLQAYISEEKDTLDLCYDCFANKHIQIEYNDVVVIQIERAYPDARIYKIDLNKITIVLNGNIYVFRAAIEHSTSHFIAHILRADSTWESYDDMKNKKFFKTPNSFYSVQYFYVNINQ